MRIPRLLAFAILSLCIVTSRAQLTSGTFPDSQNPAGPDGPQRESKIWSVDPITGALSVKIPISTTPLPAYGPTIPFILEYNSGSTISMTSQVIPSESPYINSQTVYEWKGSQAVGGLGVPRGPWTTNGPYFYTTITQLPATIPPDPEFASSCSVTGPMVYNDENGGSRTMNLLVQNDPNTKWQPCNQTTSTSGRTDDVPSMSTLTTTSSNGENLTVTYPNGTIVGGTALGYLAGGGGALMIDANGNQASMKITQTGTSTQPDMSATQSATDSLGRTIYTSTYVPLDPSYYGSPSSTDTVTTTSTTGGTNTWTIQSDTVSIGNVKMPEPTSQDIVGSPNVGVNQTVTDLSLKVITSIQLPDNTTYGFCYDPTYATISQINFPTGGYVRFKWTIRTSGNYNQLTTNKGMSTLVVSDVYLSPGTPPTCPKAGQNEAHWAYNYTPLNTSAPQLTSSVTDPFGTTTSYTGIPYDFGDTYFPGATYSFQESQRTITNSTGLLMRTIDTAGPSKSPLSIVTTYNDRTTPIKTQVAFQYDAYGNAIEKDESDFYTGTPKVIPWIRKTLTTYYWASYPAYESAHIINTPYTITVEDGSGTPVSEVQYDYDKSKPAPHGNLISEKHCLSFSGGACMTWNAPITYGYDALGERTSVTDPLGNTTTYTYTNGYVTNVAKPQTNGINHTESFSYSSSTGQMLSHTDENTQTTTYDYSDPLNMNRLTKMTLPQTVDGTTGNLGVGSISGSGYTKYNYTDTAGAFAIQTQTLMNTQGQLSSTTQLFDGLGRPTGSQTTFATPSGTLSTVTTYDAIGRIQSVSNPYLSTNDSTYGITSYVYDALDRKIFQCQPDNSATPATTCVPSSSYLQWCYNGIKSSTSQSNCNNQLSTAASSALWTDAADETGNDWQRGSDALGRLASVMEPNGASKVPSMETDYSYDVADNLTAVTQNGTGLSSVARKFSYDGLSRLTAANNPEDSSPTLGAKLGSNYCPTAGSGPWSECYAYDSNGNLISRIDNRLIVTGMTYDALNRLTLKSYTDKNGVDKTLNVAYGYDVASQSGSKYTTGRLTVVATSVAEQGKTAIVSRIYPYLYDAVGRQIGIQVAQIESPQNLQWSGHNLFYYYDLAGNVAQVNNGLGTSASATSPGITAQYSYDAVGHLTAVSASTPAFTGSNYPAALYSASSFNAVGPTAASLSIDSAGTAKYARSMNYDRRGHQTAEVDSSVTKSGTAQIYGYSNVYQTNGSISSTSDQLLGNWTFGYDTLNRVKSVNIVNGSYAGSDISGSTISWTYDPFGNRLTQTSSSGYLPSFSATFGNTTTNQASATTNGTLSYDADGDITGDGNYQYSYDAERRLCAVEDIAVKTFTQYIYDGEGNRIAKGSTTDMSCDVNNFTFTGNYLIGVSGEQLTEFDSSENWLHSNVFASGKLLTTYSGTDTYFSFNDWLGTKRVVASASGCSTNNWSTPFGDALTISGSCADVTEHHFTGKELDSESGLDYFGARYYGSSMGRFMSPDEPFVDQNAKDPQSWNLYSYGRNNPVTNTDDDGRSVNVCTNDASGNQQCTLLSNDQYNAAQQAGNGSLNVPSLNSVGTNGSGSITDGNGNSVGSATYVSDGGLDYYANQAGYNQLAGASRVVNAAGSLEMSIMAPWAGALAGCTSGGSKGSCAANLAISVLPEVAELRAGATLLRAARGLNAAEILEKGGGFAQAAKDFEALNGAEKTLGNVKIKELSDGSTAVLRNFSGDGRPTLEIQNPTGTTKFRYN